MQLFQTFTLLALIASQGTIASPDSGADHVLVPIAWNSTVTLVFPPEPSGAEYGLENSTKLANSLQERQLWCCSSVGDVISRSVIEYASSQRLTKCAIIQ